VSQRPSELLRRHGLRPKKEWGQNFLGDARILGALAELTGARPGETVVELGAGLGHFTRALAATGARVIAVERDRGERIVVCGNLPYHLSSPILFHLLDHRASLRRAVLLLQREVAERVAAPPGGRDYGVLSVLVQLVADARIGLQVDRRAFTPPPDVESSALVLDFLSGPRAEVRDERRFRALVKAAFMHRRKTLWNAVRGMPGAREALERAGIDPKRRGETLSVAEFAAVERQLP